MGNMEAVGVESGGILLIVSHFNDLNKYFWQCFSFSRDLRDHYCPLLRSAKKRIASSSVLWNIVADSRTHLSDPLTPKKPRREYLHELARLPFGRKKT
jgi:hypothetical protein